MLALYFSNTQQTRSAAICWDSSHKHKIWYSEIHK